MTMKIIVVIIILILLGFIPVWPKPVKSGFIKVDTYTKIQLALGIIRID